MPKAPRLTAAEAEAMLLRAGFEWLRSKGSHRIYQAGARRIVVPFHAGVTLHPKTVKEESTSRPRLKGLVIHSPCLISTRADLLRLHGMHAMIRWELKLCWTIPNVGLNTKLESVPDPFHTML